MSACLGLLARTGQQQTDIIRVDSPAYRSARSEQSTRAAASCPVGELVDKRCPLVRYPSHSFRGHEKVTTLCAISW